MFAGTSGSGKTRLAARLHQEHGWPVVRLDDFYRDGADPALPRSPLGIPDWDDPASWDGEAALAALAELAATGRTVMPRYDIATSRIVGSQVVSARPGDPILAEGLFAAHLVPALRQEGLLAAAWCVAHPRWLTFLRRLARDIRERRKPVPILIRRGLLLARREPALIAAIAATGAQVATPRHIRRRMDGCP